MRRFFYPVLFGNSAIRWIWGSLLSLGCLSAAGQTPCWSDTVAACNARRFPELAQPHLQTPNDAIAASQRSVATIPVVVHVVYKGNFENISDEQIFSQMTVLHADYRRLNANAVTVPPPFAPLAADMELEFCLANRAPDGTPSNGITRRPTIWDNIGQQKAPDGRPRINYTDLGGEDAWDPAHYLNIWVCGIGGGILGFATYPGTAPLPEDGVVIDPRFFGTIGLAALYYPHHLGRTATHEIGHYFNLLHIWGGDSDSCDDDDGVADTPVQRSAYQGCPAYPQFSCGNSAMFMNYMDYTDDACMSLFTLGQKARVWAALNTTRASLLDSNYCAVVPVAEPGAAVRQISIAPNPVQEKITLDLAELPDGPALIRIANPAGQILEQRTVEWFAGSPVSIDVARLPEGCYALCIQAYGTMLTRRFIKTR